MPQYRQHTETLTITAAAATRRVWDKPSSVPYKNVSILVTGNFDATNVTEEIFLGGTFTDGTNGVPPYSSDATTHIGGISQGGAAAVGASATEAADFIYASGATIFPKNQPTFIGDPVQGTTPLVLQLVNGTGGTIVVYVTFISETVNTNV